MRFALLALPWLLVSPQEDLDRRIDEFAGKIQAGSDETLARFQKAIRTRAGKIVLRDRTEKIAEGLRRQAERDAVPDYIRTRFEEVDGTYRLRAGQDDFRRRLVDDYKACKADLEKIRPVVKELADNLLDAPEVNARLKKFLSHSASLDAAYYGDFRQKSRPDIYVILKKLGELFAQTEDGKFYIPDGKRETAQVFTRLGKPLLETVQSTSAYLKKFFEGVAAFDDLHKRLKAAAEDPLFAGVVLKKSLGEVDPTDVDAAVKRFKDGADELTRQLPEVFETTPKGKVLTEKAYGEIGKVLDPYDQAKLKVRVLRPAASDLAGRLRGTDEMHQTFRSMLQSDFIINLLDIDVNEDTADPVKMITAQIQRHVQKRPDGKYEVRPESAEEVGGELKDPAGFAQKEERALRIVTMYGEKMQDKDLKEIYTSPYGRFEIEREARNALSVRLYDGLGAWIEKHFEKASAALKLRPGSKGEIEAIVAEAAKLEKEAGKNDLKD